MLFTHAAAITRKSLFNVSLLGTVLPATETPSRGRRSLTQVRRSSQRSSPLDETHPSEPISQADARVRAKDQPVRILIVEDESIVALEMKMSLRRLGYEVVGMAASGRDAVYLASLHKPNLILMDIRLRGDLDGIQAAELIRAELDTILIFVTGQADDATVKRAQKAQPAAYLNKPISAVELAETIEQITSAKT